jgi:S1-C subfamily serine protease
VSATPDGPRRICRVTLAKFPALDPLIASKRPPARGGLRVDWASTRAPQLGRGHPIPQAVVIREVLSGSAADKAHLRPDMIITSVNGQKVANPADFYRQMDKANGPVELTFGTIQGDAEQRVTLDIK